MSSTERALTPNLINRILVVEDDPGEAQALKAILTKAGYNVVVAKDGGQATSMFVMRKPDFVILDLILSGESGFEICERLRNVERHLPIMVVSAIDLDDSKDLARRVGANAYITKPYDPEELLKRIKITAETVWRRQHDEGTSQGDEPEAVRFHCRCGKRFKVSAAHRGKTLTCPNCGEPVVVPRHD
jgi:two-component system, OmpR family, response regulator